MAEILELKIETDRLSMSQDFVRGISVMLVLMQHPPRDREWRIYEIEADGLLNPLERLVLLWNIRHIPFYQPPTLWQRFKNFMEGLSS